MRLTVTSMVWMVQNFGVVTDQVNDTEAHENSTKTPATLVT
jgi:hypothetical protein